MSNAYAYRNPSPPFFRHAPAPSTGAMQRCNAPAPSTGAWRRAAGAIMPSFPAQGQMPSASGHMPSTETRHLPLGTTERERDAYAAGKETDKHGGVFRVTGRCLATRIAALGMPSQQPTGASSRNGIMIHMQRGIPAKGFGRGRCLDRKKGR